MKKKLLILSIIIFSSINVFPQKQEVCIPWDKTIVPIYANELQDSIIYTVYQDYDAEDHLYEVFAIEKSPLRFKVELRDKYDRSGKFTTGWIDKKYCGVYDRWYYDEQNRGYIMLYECPSKDSRFIKIYQSPFRALTVVDYDGPFVKIMFEVDNVIYTGWIDRYCPIIENSCT